MQISLRDLIFKAETIEALETLYNLAISYNASDDTKRKWAKAFGVKLSQLGFIAFKSEDKVTFEQLADLDEKISKNFRKGVLI